MLMGLLGSWYLPVIFKIQPFGGCQLTLQKGSWLSSWVVSMVNSEVIGVALGVGGCMRMGPLPWTRGEEAD